MDEGIPAHAEMFNLSDFVSYKKGPPSKYIPSKRTADVQEFFCPACGIENPAPRHNKNSKCTRCDLQWIAVGNALSVWK